MANSFFVILRKDVERYSSLKYLNDKPWWRRYATGMMHRGFRVVLYFRLRHSMGTYNLAFRLLLLPFLFIARLVIQPETSCELPMECNIGAGLFLPHPFGIAVAHQSILGGNCSIFSGVVIGINHLKNRAGPIIGDNVTIYAGAKVIGQVRVDSNVIIGANSVVLNNIPEGAIVAGAPMRIIRFRDLDDVLEF